MKRIFPFLMIFWFSFTTSAFIIEIENGKIEGEEHENFIAFKGIQYATAERYSPSKPYLEKWSEVREFKKFVKCAQFDHFKYEFDGIEDCLTLNIFVPKNVINSVEEVPVIFFIHGGGFTFGQTDMYEPENIMEHGKMIFVSVAYRLGILGFLSTEDEVLPGNLGLKDQVEALKWVQRNIRAFNGNPDKVTLIGFSAGGASVHLHYMSKLSDGLFNNGISVSGVATNPWVLMENAKEKAHKVAEYAGCPIEDHERMIKCLKEKPVEELVLLTQKFQPFMFNPFTPFGVAVEPESDQAFISEHPYEILKKGNYKKLPWLLSQVKDEGSYPSAEFYSDEKFLQEINERWEELAQYILHLNNLSKNEKLKMQISKQIRSFYMGNEEISRKNFQNFNDIITDWMFKYDAKKSLEVQSKFSSSYMYYFNYKSLLGLGELWAHADIGISHGEDIFLIFHLLRTNPYSNEEKKMTNNLIEMIYSFATENVPSFSGLQIEKSTPDKLTYLEIISNENFTNVEMDKNFGRVKFWDRIEKSLTQQSHAGDEL